MIKRIEEVLQAARAQLQASSCVLYLSDPNWPGEFRLLGFCGVRFEEPMFGFVYLESARQLLKGHDDVFECYPNNFDGSSQSTFLGIPQHNRFLFGNFREREGVVAYAKVIKELPRKDQHLILFVNYNHSQEFDKELKSLIRASLTDLTDVVTTLDNELIADDLEWRSEATKIVSPGRTVASMDFEASGQPNTFFNVILEAALSALGIPRDTGLGVIHLYNPEKQLLELHGICGNAEYSTDQNHSVNEGVGIISWVALTKRALIIQNLQRSEFNRIHVSINKDTKTELAVPLEIGGELIGTMCLGCTEENSFLPHHAYSVWYAANQAVLAYQLFQLGSINRKLLDLCWRAATEDAHVSLDELAILAKDYLKASYCEISRYNDQTDSFKSGGASYPNFEPQIRKGGWTEFVRSEQRAVCISNIGDPITTSVHVWDGQKWVVPPASDDFPIDINPTAIEGGVHTALGIPITIHHDCIGVAWVKYRHPRAGCPKPAFMALALGFAAEAGLVLETIERREVDLKVRKEIDAVASAIACAIKERWELHNCSMLDCYVISHPMQSSLGGDFYAGKVIDKNTVGILMLDGQGHGVGGSLHMLPLMTAFESFCQSYSTAHVISSLAKTAETLGVGGCAVYGILTRIDDKRWLSVTSAGPESLLLFRRIPTRAVIVCEHLPKNPALQFTHPLKEPFMDHRVEVEAGDVIVLYSDGIADTSLKFNQTHLATFVTNFLDEKNVKSPTEFAPKEIAQAILEKSRSEQDGSFSDDVTIIVARVN